MVSDVRLYRKRFIPDELLHLKDDKILYMDDELLITSWNTLKPRADMATGISAYYRKEGVKISRLADAHGTLTRWYCDIVSETADGYDLTYSDLLIDIVILPDGTVQVVDLDEAADALEQGLITQDMLVQALRSTDKLLRYIKQDKFNELTKCILQYTNEL